MNSTSYIKEQTLAIPAKCFTLTGIPAFKSVQLSFYQKYIVLLLQKGIKAVDLVDLSQQLSAIINLSTVCVKEFLDYLYEEGHLIYSSNTYILNDALHVQINPAMNNAMFADLDVQEADCDKIIFVEEINRFFLESDFPTDFFRRIEQPPGLSSITIAPKIKKAIDENTENVRCLIAKSFQDSSVHLLPNIEFELVSSSCHECRIEFDVSLKYYYSSETKTAVRTETIIPEQNVLPKEYIDWLSEKFNVDKKLPRFIALDESFYKKVLPNVDSITDFENRLSNQHAELYPLEEDVKKVKRELEATKQLYKREKKSQENQANQVAQNLREIDAQIKKRQTIIASTTETHDIDIIESLQNDVRELNEKKERLAQEVEEREKSLKSLEEEYKQKKEVLNQTLAEKEGEKAKIIEEVTTLNKQKVALESENKSLLSSNKEKLHPIIRSVIEKYFGFKNNFSSYVVKTCSILDSALSASEHDAFDALWLEIDQVRHPYQKTFFAIYNTFLTEKHESLGIYVGNPYSRSHIEDWFRVEKIPLSIFRDLLAFHTLVTAVTHGTEKGVKSSSNKKQIESFKQMNRAERAEVLLSAPNFFKSVEFKKADIKKIIQYLEM